MREEESGRREKREEGDFEGRRRGRRRGEGGGEKYDASCSSAKGDKTEAGSETLLGEARKSRKVGMRGKEESRKRNLSIALLMRSPEERETGW